MVDRTGFGVVPKVFQGMIQPQNVVRMYGVELDALFRLTVLDHLTRRKNEPTEE